MARDRGGGRGSGGRGHGSGQGHRGGRGRGRGAEGPIEPGTFPIDAGTAEVLADPWTEGAWLLKVNGAESSQLNPGNPLDLGFEYMRWIAAVMRHRWEPGAPLRILHLGGAGCTLARWAAAWYPQSRQTAVELDAGLAALARDRFALPRAPQLRIRVGEAGAVLAGARADSRDVVIRDVFAGTSPEDQVTPGHLMGLDAARHASRVLGDEGIYLVNHGGGPDLTAARREAATLCEVFGSVAAIADPQMLKGRRRGNIVLAATHGTLTATGRSGPLSRDALVRHLLSDPLPARLVDPVRDFAAGARPFDTPLPVTRLESPSARVNDDSGVRRQEAVMTGSNEQDHTPNLEERATTHGIVVGIDGSEQSVSAAKWGAREAELRGLPLTLVTAYTMPVFAASALEAGYGVPDDTMIRDGAMQVLQGVVNQLGNLDVPLVHRVEMGDAAGVLVDYSENANLLVAGTRGRGGFLGRLLGSVASALPAHAKCPVVIVPKGEHASRASAGTPVVVGVDGSEQGRVAALAAAIEADVRQAPLRVVIAMPPISGAVAWLPATVDEQSMVEEMQERLDAGVEWLRSEFPGLEVSAEIVDGVPVDVMVNESRSARLTVAGTRGHGGFTGALLGSTSQGVIQHAHGPVMVVPYLKDSRLANRASFGPTFS